MGSHSQRDCLVQATAPRSEGNAVGLEALLAKRSGRGRSLHPRLSQTRAGGVTGGPCSVTQDPPRMISVLSSTNGCVGFLRSARPRGFQAYDADGQPLGVFAEKQAAIEAITAPNSTEMTNENLRTSEVA